MSFQQFGRQLRRVPRWILAVGLVAGTVACEVDNNPYGPAYRAQHPTIVGVYRPIEFLKIRRSSLPSDVRPVPPGADIRLVFGSAMTLAGRIFLPDGGSGGGTLDARFYGSWEYDRTSRRITARVEPSATIPATEAVFQITILDEWVRLEGTADIAGSLLSFDLGKSLLEPEAPTGGGPGFGNRVPARKG